MKVLVTGGGGFLGRAIVELLLNRGDQVRSFSRGAYPDLEARGVEVIRGDIANAVEVAAACKGMDAAIHTAAKAGVWGSSVDYYVANVQGTVHVIAGCREHGVPKLVHTSSPSVVFNGGDMEGANESAPYGNECQYDSAYPWTKRIAEGLALEANSPALAVTALRPHLIWGPGDPHLIPRVLGRARRLRIIGDGLNRVDTIHVLDAARGHLQALDRLAPGAPPAGKAYFLSAGDPRPLWEIINRILAAGGLPPVTRRISPGMAMAAAGMMESLWHLFRIKTEPPLTRFVVKELSTSHWFDISAARRDFGFEPTVGFEDGMKGVEQWIRETGLKAVIASGR